MASYCNFFYYNIFTLQLWLLLILIFSRFQDDAVFRRKIAESANADERIRSNENKRGRWDQPDTPVNNTEDHWERIIERARNQRGFVSFYY